MVKLVQLLDDVNTLVMLPKKSQSSFVLSIKSVVPGQWNHFTGPTDFFALLFSTEL